MSDWLWMIEWLLMIVVFDAWLIDWLLKIVVDCEWLISCLWLIDGCWRMIDCWCSYVHIHRGRTSIAWRFSTCINWYLDYGYTTINCTYSCTTSKCAAISTWSLGADRWVDMILVAVVCGGCYGCCCCCCCCCCYGCCYCCCCCCSCYMISRYK